MGIRAILHLVVFICVGCAFVLWLFIGLVFLCVTVYNRVSNKRHSICKHEIKGHDNIVNDNDRSDLFL